MSDLAAAMSAVLVVVGERLGPYQALGAGALMPLELAGETGTDDRYVREWLNAQTAKQCWLARCR